MLILESVQNPMTKNSVAIVMKLKVTVNAAYFQFQIPRRFLPQPWRLADFYMQRLAAWIEPLAFKLHRFRKKEKYK